MKDIPICDVRLDETQHLFRCLGDLDENTVVDLQKTQQLQNLFWLGSEVVDTIDCRCQ